MIDQSMPARGSALPELLGALVTAVVVMALLTFGYSAQHYAPLPPVSGSEPAIPALMFFTLGAAIVIGAVGLVLFLQSRHNRAIANRTVGTGT